MTTMSTTCGDEWGSQTLHSPLAPADRYVDQTSCGDHLVFAVVRVGETAWLVSCKSDAVCGPGARRSRDARPHSNHASGVLLITSDDDDAMADKHASV